MMKRRCWLTLVVLTLIFLLFSHAFAEFFSFGEEEIPEELIAPEEETTSVPALDIAPKLSMFSAYLSIPDRRTYQGGWEETYLSILSSNASGIRRYQEITGEYSLYAEEAASWLHVCLYDLTGDGFPELLFTAARQDSALGGMVADLYLYTSDGTATRCVAYAEHAYTDGGDGPYYRCFIADGQLVMEYGNGYDDFIRQYRLSDFTLTDLEISFTRLESEDIGFTNTSYQNSRPISGSDFQSHWARLYQRRSLLIASDEDASDIPEALYTVDGAISYLRSLTEDTPSYATSVPYTWPPTATPTPLITPSYATSAPYTWPPTATPTKPWYATSVPYTLPPTTTPWYATSVPYTPPDTSIFYGDYPYVVPVVSADATSWIIGRSNPYGYIPSKMLDGQDSTSFQFSTRTTPLGQEYIYFSFGQPVRLGEMWIKNGSWRSRDHYLQNCRVRRMAIEFATSGWTYGDRMEVTLPDDATLWGWQRIDLGDRANVLGVRLLILDAYIGTKYPNDVAIAEVQFMSREQYGGSIGATTEPRVSTGAIYGLAIDKLATRTGPSTRYSEGGTYSVKGQYIRILSRAYDRANGIWWVECEIPYRNETRVLWTGYKRFDSSTCPLDTIPINEWY